MEERRNLSKHFGAYWANERNDDWQNLVSRVNIGDSLQGKVVYQCYYGVFLDVGIGFPACLTKLNSSRPTCDPNPDLGAMLEVRVREVNSNEHIVDLAEIEEPGTTGS